MSEHNKSITLLTPRLEGHNTFLGKWNFEAKKRHNNNFGFSENFRQDITRGITRKGV